jgi:hypothetical protein
VCQNEEDDDYYGKLQIEFNTTVHRVADSNLIREIMQSTSETNSQKKNVEVDLKELADKLSKNLDMSLR